ncbi:MAG: ATP synthase F0 subunit B [Anaerolineaceae bacterium]|nr:ATP synthase F0 subunit B [Anaerolineaceae bacterium]
MMKQTLKRLLPVSVMLATALAMSPLAALAQEEHAAEAAAESPLTPLGINAGLLFTHTFNFILIAVILSVVMWRPMVNFLDARSARIQKGLEDAAAAARARQNAEAEAEKILAAARAEAAKVLEEARGRGDEVAASIQTAASEEAEQIKTTARDEAVAARNAELAGLRDQVLNISSAMAGRILGEQIDASKQQALVSDFFSNLPADAKSLSGSVEVVSAMPLSEAEQKRVSSEVGADDITFTVDPAILGGLIVRAPGRVIDGSVRSNLTSLSGRLN